MLFSDEEITLRVLAGLPAPRQCAAKDCGHVGRGVNRDVYPRDAGGEYCWCCIVKFCHGLSNTIRPVLSEYRKESVYTCTGEVVTEEARRDMLP